MKRFPKNENPITSNTKNYKSQQYIIIINLKNLIDKKNENQLQNTKH